MKYWIVIMISLMLQACSTISANNTISAAKREFSAGDYKQAFHEMLPLASKGNADAQYAVGYMYYYGFGVAQDYESGVFWMKKAAEQQNASAIRALKLIPPG